VVLEYLDVHRDFFEPLVSGPVLDPKELPEAGALDLGRVVDTPPDEMTVPTTVWSPTARLARVDFVARDAANRDLGRRGEEFVLELERRRLHDAGRRELGARVEWTAQVRGDGAGYDIQSFDVDGTGRLIEVKTTGSTRCSIARSCRRRGRKTRADGSRAKPQWLDEQVGTLCAPLLSEPCLRLPQRLTLGRPSRLPSSRVSCRSDGPLPARSRGPSASLDVADPATTDRLEAGAILSMLALRVTPEPSREPGACSMVRAHAPCAARDAATRSGDRCRQGCPGPGEDVCRPGVR